MLAQVLHLRAVFVRLVKVDIAGLLVGKGQIKAVAKADQVVFGKLLLRMRGHLALPGTAHAVTFFGVRQNHYRLACVRRSSGISGMYFHQVVAAALEPVDLLVGHALGQAGEFRVLTKKGVTVKAPVFGGKSLHLAIDRAGKGFGQCAGGVAGKQAIPVAAPHQFDDMPASAGKQFFQLIDDAAIAAHRAIEALQIAVHHPHQVVQIFAGSQG